MARRIFCVAWHWMVLMRRGSSIAGIGGATGSAELKYRNRLAPEAKFSQLDTQRSITDSVLVPLAGPRIPPSNIICSDLDRKLHMNVS
jgi:hypothetical protein